MMFPDMSRVSLERTFQAWNYDMERTVTVVLGVQEGIIFNMLLCTWALYDLWLMSWVNRNMEIHQYRC